MTWVKQHCCVGFNKRPKITRKIENCGAEELRWNRYITIVSNIHFVLEVCVGKKKLVICERQKCIFSIFRDEAIFPWSVLWLCFMICFHWIWRLQYSWAPVVHRHPTVLPEQIPALFFFSSVLLGSSSFYWKWEEAKNSNTRGCLYSFWIIYELFQNLMKSYRRYYPWRKTLWITSKISYIQHFLSSIFQLIKICSVCFLFVFCFSMQSQLWQVTPCCNEEDTLAVTMGSEAWECARTLGLSGGVWH